jgi:hypothetical protein
MTLHRGAVLTPQGVRLRKLWDEYRANPFPAARTDDARLQEIALYASWLGSLVDVALTHGGRLTRSHRRLLAARSEEHDPSVWRAASDLGEPVRSFVARLLAMEGALAELPDALN